MMSQTKGGIDSLVKEQLPVDSLVKEKLRGLDCGCTNSGDGDDGDWNVVCDLRVRFSRRDLRVRFSRRET
ncbi:hypothetical protein BgiMline_012371 [Biomphalaria glabrata]|nr:hypothetical protein BgiMline_032423 [Biomphalaria glabrata]KAI8728882.1 hypothetical protein BgiMline_032425 [Biomphalaria glabrata]